MPNSLTLNGLVMLLKHLFICCCALLISFSSNQPIANILWREKDTGNTEDALKHQHTHYSNRCTADGQDPTFLRQKALAPFLKVSFLPKSWLAPGDQSQAHRSQDHSFWLLGPWGTWEETQARQHQLVSLAHLWEEAWSKALRWPRCGMAITKEMEPLVFIPHFLWWRRGYRKPLLMSKNLDVQEAKVQPLPQYINMLRKAHLVFFFSPTAIKL